MINLWALDLISPTNPHLHNQSSPWSYRSLYGHLSSSFLCFCLVIQAEQWKALVISTGHVSVKQQLFLTQSFCCTKKAAWWPSFMMQMQPIVTTSKGLSKAMQCEMKRLNLTCPFSEVSHIKANLPSLLKYLVSMKGCQHYFEVERCRKRVTQFVKQQLLYSTKINVASQQSFFNALTFFQAALFMQFLLQFAIW